MKEFFYEILTRPLFNLLIFLYSIVGDLGVAIIVFTLIVKLILYPLTKKQIKAQEEMKKIQPKLAKLKEKYKDDKEKLMLKQTELYKKEGVNPASGCLPLLVQMPIFIAIFWMLRPGPDNVFSINQEHLMVSKEALYNFPSLKNIEEVNKNFLNLIDLTKKSTLIALIAAGLQFLYSKIMSAKNKNQKKAKEKNQKKKGEPEIQDIMAQQMQNMTYIFPALTFIIGLSLPAGLPLYWASSTFFSIIQHKIDSKKKKSNPNKNEINKKGRQR
ncbi:MAG: membrane protein insertase YidC [Candidatus Moranbacteria bacterium]|nr:membrane protein insertase YidC [Candidatus Moranbacteria bacterium]